MDKKSESKFSDILGALVTGVAHGRNVSDVEAMRIARIYNQNELLKGLPIPRLRIHRMSINLPIILSEVIPGTPAERNDTEEIARVVAEVFENGIKEGSEHQKKLAKYKKFAEDEKNSVHRLKRFLDFCDPEKNPGDPSAPGIFRVVLSNQLKHAFLNLEHTEGSTTPSDASIRDTAAETAENTLHDIMSELYYRYIQKRVAEEKIEDDTVDEFNPERARRLIEEFMEEEDYIKQLIRNIRLAAEEAAIIKPTVAPDFHVIVDTDSIKNAGGGPDVVTRVNIVMHEEGLEWLSEIRDGKETTTLIPE